MDRNAIVKPRARLQKLTVRIQKLTERYVVGTPKANLQLLVLNKLEIKKGEFTEEIGRIEAVHRHQNRSKTPPLSDPVINETDERTGTPLAGQLETDQPGVFEPGVTEERVKSLIQEFADSTVQPLETKVKKAMRQTLLFAEKTRDNLVKAEERITIIEDEYRDDVVLHNEHYQQTEDLEYKTSRIVDDMDRFERETEQRFTEVDEDLGRSRNEVGSTLDRVTDLEKKNASLEDCNDKLEADLKALTEQDALDEETRKEKETPRLSKEEIAERERNTAAKYPGHAKSVAIQAAKDAERLNAQKQGFEEFSRAHKKKKAASSSSAPVKRKRKVSARKMLERIKETNVDTPPNPPQTEDEDEEHLEQRSTRQRVSDTVPISTVSQPQAGGSSSRPDQPDKEKPTKDMMDGFTFSESE
ncbi:inner centromere protein-like [Impatiens glandulifera]|uniref:inner centromere protein-like n=1 Tax=Impatiens glandulifera TaxID=253017 RepID=UPI001FB066FC|nr:inner centromere protein-like [Impatiens glandulifera]